MPPRWKATTCTGGLAELYSGNFKAFAVLRWQDIVSELEEALDGFEDVSYLVATIAVKHA